MKQPDSQRGFVNLDFIVLMAPSICVYKDISALLLDWYSKLY